MAMPTKTYLTSGVMRMNEAQMERIRALSMSDEHLIEQCVEERKRLKKQVTQLSDSNLAQKFGCETWQVRKIAKYGARRAG